MKVQRTGDIVTATGASDAGTVELQIDTKDTGFIRRLKIGEKLLVSGDTNAPPLFASVIESNHYDGISDLAGGQVIPAAWRLEKCTVRQEGGKLLVISTGRLAWPGGDALEFQMDMTVDSDGQMLLSVRFVRHGEFKNRFLRELGLQVPLALNYRKRVVQAGDRGIQFDTRAAYEFHMFEKFLQEPDFNFWQHFHIDQATGNDYHIWRSESLATSALSMFRGRQAAGWMTAYDQTGGVLLAYRDMAKAAPKDLYVSTRDGGKAVVYFHGPTHRAVQVSSDEATAHVLAREHKINWIFFAGENAKVMPDRRLAKTWGLDALASDGPVRPDPTLDAIDLLDAKLSDGPDAPLVTGGVPLPRGEITVADQVRLFRGTQEVPLQARVLGYWPDKSIKWLLLTFPLADDTAISVQPGSGNGKDLPFNVTLRDKGKSPFVLRYGKDVCAGKVVSPMTAGKSADGATISTGPLELTLAKGTRWLKGIKFKGRQMLRDSTEPLTFVDFLQVDGNHSPMTTHASGQEDNGELAVTDLQLEEAGPLRAVVRLEGLTASREPTRVIMRLEAFAGRSHVRMLHSVEFGQIDPRMTFVRRMGLRLPLKMDANSRLAAGGRTGPIELEPAKRTGLLQANPLSYELWQQDGQPVRRIRQDGNRCRGWLDWSDKTAGVAAILRNMWQEAPKELTAGDGMLSVYFWPQSQPVMDVRRYSNYPHPAQGEAIPDALPLWVDQVYYQHDPFCGVSKTHELMLYFHDASASHSRIDALAADFQSPGLVYCGSAWYWDTKVVMPTIVPGDPRYALAEGNINRFAKFILFHQKYWGWYGLWDYGDIGHMFKNGYGKIITPESLGEIVKLDVDDRGKYTGPVTDAQDYWPQHDWAYDNGRWGWGNTEGLPNLFMTTQYLRTGDRDVYFFCEAMSRHVRDVDMRHSGQYFGRGTRHGVQHWSDGDHEERQTTNTEFRYMHYLSGDMRSADFARQLTEGAYLKGICNVHADHSARLYGLLTRWEMTGDERLGTILHDYIHCLIVPEGLAVSTPVKFPEAQLAGKPADVNSGSMFFLYFGGIQTLLEYYELTGDQALRDALVQYAQKGNDDIVDRGGNTKAAPLAAVAFAARYAPDHGRFQQALSDRIQTDRRIAYQQIPEDPSRWTGISAPPVSFPVALFWMNEEGYVMTSLEREPAISPKQEADMKAKAQYSGPTQVPAERESWQDQYDRPEFRGYMTPKRELEP